MEKKTKPSKAVQKAPKNPRFRVQKLLSHITEGVAILSAGSPITRERNLDRKFHAQGNFFYCTGLEQSDAIAIVTNSHPSHRYVIFWREADQKERIWNGPRPGFREVKKQTGADEVYPLEEFRTKLPEYLEGARNLYYSLGIDPGMDKIVLETRQRISRQNYIPKVTPLAIWDLEKSMEEMRICKDEHEVSLIRQAAHITHLGYQEAFLKTAPGLYEHEVEALLYYVFRKEGADGTSFPSIVASGSNSTVLHYTQNNRRIEDGDLILVDSGAEYRHYCADVTRTWPANGKFSKTQRALYQAVLEAQKKAIASIEPGVKIEQFHLAAVHELVEHMLKLKLLTGNKEKIIQEKKYEKFYMHKTGHHLGIDVHDLGGFYDSERPRVFAPGMVITVEPGIYISPDEKSAPPSFRGIGVRIEDDVLVTETGHEVLTSCIPKEIEELEKVVRS